MDIDEIIKQHEAGWMYLQRSGYDDTEIAELSFFRHDPPVYIYDVKVLNEELFPVMSHVNVDRDAYGGGFYFKSRLNGELVPDIEMTSFVFEEDGVMRISMRDFR